MEIEKETVASVTQAVNAISIDSPTVACGMIIACAILQAAKELSRALRGPVDSMRLSPRKIGHE